MSTIGSYTYITNTPMNYVNHSDHLTTAKAPMNSVANSTSDLQDEAFFDYFILVLYFFTALTAMLGNLFVCHVIHKTPKFKSTTFTLLFNMAVSDFCSGLIILLQWLFCSYHIVEHYSPRLCVLSKSFQILSYYVSTYSMMFIAIDRYMLIRHPHTKGLSTSKYICCFITWLVGGLFSLSTLFNMRINEYFGPKHLISCRIAYPVEGQLAFILRKHRIAVLIVSQFVIPLLVIIFLYSIIWDTIRKREIVGNAADANKRKQFSKNKKKLIQMLIIVVLAFIVAWTPVHTIHFFNFYIVQLLPRSCNSGG